MADQNEIPSRLQQRQQVLRGVGAGYAVNQKMAGVEDPETAARLARMSPDELAAAQEEGEKEVEKVNLKMEDLLVAIGAGKYSPPIAQVGLRKDKAPTDPDGWRNLLSRVDSKIVDAWHTEMKAKEDAEIDKETAEVAESMIGNPTNFDSAFRSAPENPNYNPMLDSVRRKRIEEKLAPMGLEDMVFKGFVEQDIPTQQGLTLTFRSLTTQHGLWLEFAVSQMEEGAVQYSQFARHSFGLMQVACSLDKVNGKPIGPDLSKFVRPEHRDEFMKALEKRMEFLGKLPAELTNDFIVQFIWFSGRVRKVLSGNLLEKVGN